MTAADTGPAAPPVPVADEASAGFWQHAADGILSAQRCDKCGWWAYPPTSVCTKCLVDPPAFSWTPVSGRGTLATWTVVRDALLPGFAEHVPYVVAEAELPEQRGLRVVARLRGVSEEELEVGLALRVAFVDGGEGTRIPVFERVAS